MTSPALTFIASPVAVAERIARTCTETPEGCWVTSLSLDRKGYGRIEIRQGGPRRRTGAHRAMWLAMVGDLPDDIELQLDHLCRNRACVNPWHMEPVTNVVNVRRGEAGRARGLGAYACGRHGREDGYLYTRPSGVREWRCRTCRNAHNRRYRSQAPRAAAPCARVEEAVAGGEAITPAPPAPRATPPV